MILWRNRFRQGGTVALLEEAPGRGRPKQIIVTKVKRIVEATLHTTPKAATHWSVRTMAQLHGVSPATTLFAALNVLDGTVIGECMPRHRHQEYLKFLRKLDRETPPGLALHLIVDNSRAMKTTMS